VEMAENLEQLSLITPMNAFVPMKPKKRFYQINDLLEYLFGGA